MSTLRKGGVRARLRMDKGYEGTVGTTTKTWVTYPSRGTATATLQSGTALTRRASSTTANA